MKHTLVISDNCYKELKQELLKDGHEENAAFMLIGINKQHKETKYLTRRIIKIPRRYFKIKSSYHLNIQSETINGIVSLCESNGLGLAVCHSHPFSTNSLDYSKSDNFGELRIKKLFDQILPGKPFISILIGSNLIKGRIWSSNKPKDLNQINVIGENIWKIEIGGSDVQMNFVQNIFDRQISAFGSKGQHFIQNIKVGIVGVGGTGSIVSEQLVRLGVNDLVLIDHDTIEPSNITRMYGTNIYDIKKRLFKSKRNLKVDIIGNHLKEINPNLKLTLMKTSVVVSTCVNTLLDRDVIFSCTDDHWGRSILNQLAYQYLIPTINIGVRIDAKSGQFSAGSVTIQILRPDLPCLWCYKYLKPEIIAAESMKPDDRKKLIRDNYVQDIDLKTPSVISYTSLGGSMGVNLFLNLVTGFLGEYGYVSSLRYDILNGDIRRGKVEIGECCICSKNLAFGDYRKLNTIDQKIYDSIRSENQ